MYLMLEDMFKKLLFDSEGEFQAKRKVNYMFLPNSYYKYLSTAKLSPDIPTLALYILNYRELLLYWKKSISVSLMGENSSTPALNQQSSPRLKQKSYSFVETRDLF